MWFDIVFLLSAPMEGNLNPSTSSNKNSSFTEVTNAHAQNLLKKITNRQPCVTCRKARKKVSHADLSWWNSHLRGRVDSLLAVRTRRRNVSMQKMLRTFRPG